MPAAASADRRHAAPRAAAGAGIAAAGALALLVCGGCDDPPLLRSADGSYELRAALPRPGAPAPPETDTFAALLQRDVDAVLAQRVGTAHDLSLWAHQRDHAGLLLVGIGDGVPELGPAWVADGSLAASIEPQLGADTALDLAVLLCRDVAIARPEILLGCRIVRANEPEGRPQPHPDDLYLTALRARHAAELADPKPLRLGVVLGAGGAPLRQAQRAQCEAWGARHAFATLDVRPADDADAQRQALRELADAGADAVVLSPFDAAATAEACRAAVARGVRVVVLGASVTTAGATLAVRADDELLGRAAGNAMRALLPDGGGIAELLDPQLDAESAQRRRLGFAAALGLEPPR
ncbi:MAG: substrate-binding domain-containing protein [Planctomycetota bacterium]